MRSTMFHIPTANDVKKIVGIPLGLHISPMAEQHPDEVGMKEATKRRLFSFSFFFFSLS
jgi:hypothetical protein